jgi:hypothetical protein
MTDAELQEALKQVSYYIRRDVASGFAKLDEIVPNALEVVSDDYDSEELRPHAQRVLNEAVEEQRRREAQWPAVTDWDRFDAAFLALEEAGVVCRHNFSCCGTCAAGEIWDEIEAQRDKGREVIGCAHYNVQDTESAVEGQGVYLSYGSVLRGERASVAIGHDIAKAMQDQGLVVTWDGTLGRRIHVGMEWRRRMAGAGG